MTDKEIVDKIWKTRCKFYTKSGAWEYLCLAQSEYLAAIQSYQAYIAQTEKMGYNEKVIGTHIHVDERGFRKPGKYIIRISKLENDGVLDEV